LTDREALAGVEPVAVRARREDWIGLAVLALPTLLVTMDMSVLFLAVPKLTRALHPSSAELVWITDIYGFFIAGSLLTMGALGDRIGHRRLLLCGGAAFALGSLVAAFSASPAMLIAARALLGIAGASLAPSSLALITTMFADERQRATAIGVWISCFAAGAAIGPLVGGALLEHFWWGSVFLPNVAAMGLLLAVGPRTLPSSSGLAGTRLDLPSAVLATGAVLAGVYAITRIAEHGFRAAEAGSIALGLVLGTIFIVRQRRLSEPLVDLSLFRARAFNFALGANCASAFVAIGIELFTAQYLQLVLGLRPFVAGLWSLPSAAGIIAGSMMAPRLTKHVAPARIVPAGLVLAAAGLLILTLAGPSSGLAAIVAGTALIGLGVGPVGALATDLIVGAAPPEAAGAASGISETGTELGGALGVAILGSVGAAVYRGKFGTRLLSAGAPPHARETLGGAVSASRGLRAGLSDQVLSAAHAAFVDGFRIASLLGAGLALVMAALIVGVPEMPLSGDRASEHRSLPDEPL
jgi:DHA2 family multidrug resistance protein-like MFS transporter